MFYIFYKNMCQGTEKTSRFIDVTYSTNITFCIVPIQFTGCYSQAITIFTYLILIPLLRERREAWLDLKRTFCGAAQ